MSKSSSTSLGKSPRWTARSMASATDRRRGSTKRSRNAFANVGSRARSVASPGMTAVVVRWARPVLTPRTMTTRSPLVVPVSGAGPKAWNSSRTSRAMAPLDGQRQATQELRQRRILRTLSAWLAADGDPVERQWLVRLSYGMGWT
jgi:hypothetical protein